MERPFGPPWRSEVWVDPCFGDHRRIIILQNEATGDRLKINMADKTVTAVFNGPPQRLDRLIDRIQRSFSGERKISPELQAFLETWPRPLPTVGPCDDPSAIPTLQPEPTPWWPTLTPEPTSTPEPIGTEFPSSPQPGEPPPEGP